MEKELCVPVGPVTMVHPASSLAPEARSKARNRVFESLLASAATGSRPATRAAATVPPSTTAPVASVGPSVPATPIADGPE